MPHDFDGASIYFSDLGYTVFMIPLLIEYRYHQFAIYYFVRIFIKILEQVKWTELACSEGWDFGEDRCDQSNAECKELGRKYVQVFGINSIF